MQSSAEKVRDKRDILNFLDCRLARPSEDYLLGNLLIRAFVDTYARKLPKAVTNQERKEELMNVGQRRKDGLVYLLELGYKIVGTFSLIHPEAATSQSWMPRSANLRCLAVDPDYHGYGFSERLLEKAIQIARGWKCESVALHVQDGADGVARLYERYGFERCPQGDQETYGSRILAYLLRL